MILEKEESNVQTEREIIKLSLFTINMICIQIPKEYKNKSNPLKVVKKKKN